MKKAINIFPFPHRFNVKVKRLKLAKLLLKELIHYGPQKEVILSRPCIYGVFSGPVGGFAPRENLCVGCLRCTVEHPEMVTVSHNPDLQLLGDEYFTPLNVATVVYEAETGRVPIKGAGYRGKFGGIGWDSIWTDMSEIVRPTRDGIHGREFISTEVDIGSKPPFLQFDEGKIVGQIPNTIRIPIPILFDLLPLSVASHKIVHEAINHAAKELQTFAIVPFKSMSKGIHSIPLIDPEEYEEFKLINRNPPLITLSGWDESVFKAISRDFPNTHIILRVDFESVNLLTCYHAGVRIFHFVADYHGRGKGDKFIIDLIREAHLTFVNAGCREEVTLLGSGGIIAAEHLPKAIILGLDAVVLDTPLMVALQAQFKGPCVNNKESHFSLPLSITADWGRQRLVNLVGSWHAQLLEIMGAMGLREVRRLRGEMGRAMFQDILEKEAFEGIPGYDR